MKDFPIDDRNEIGKKKQKVPRAMMSNLAEDKLREMIRKEITNVNEGDELQRWKVYIKGEKEPLILTGKDKNSVKKFAHQMIKNNKVKIARVVKEGLIKEFNKKHFLKLIQKEVESVIGQKKYVRGKLKDKNLEGWEKKEYEAVWKELNKRAKELGVRLRNTKLLPEVKQLNEFGTDISALNLGGNFHIHPERKKQTNQGQYLQGYSTKEARAIIDGELKKWAKQLRKVEYNVIKDWMKAAKQGSIDFFDLIRGLKTGDIARAHPYETEFLVKLLTRDKIIKRFRSYFAGKKGKPGRTK